MQALYTILDYWYPRCNEWLDKESTITDKWSDTIITVSIRELVKQSFENLIEKNVDDDGRPTNYHGKPFIDWKINKMIEREVSSRMKDFSSIIDNKIKEHIESKIKENVANRLLKW